MNRVQIKLSLLKYLFHYFSGEKNKALTFHVEKKKKNKDGIERINCNSVIIVLDKRTTRSIFFSFFSMKV